MLLIYYGVVVAEVSACEVAYLFLCYVCYSVELLHFCLPVASVYECVHECGGSAFVAVERAEEVEFHVVDDRRQQLCVEVAAFKLLHFAEHEALHLVEALSFEWHTQEQELRIVAHVEAECLCGLAAHGLVDVEVEESCLAVVEHVAYHLQCVVLQTGGSVELPCKHYVLRFLSHYGAVLRCCEVFHGCVVGLFHLAVAFP